MEKHKHYMKHPLELVILYFPTGLESETVKALMFAFIESYKVGKIYMCMRIVHFAILLIHQLY